MRRSSRMSIDPTRDIMELPAKELIEAGGKGYALLDYDNINIQIVDNRRLLIEALINNTFTLSSVEQSLTETLDNSFSYLYRLQRSLIGYEEFHFKTKEDPNTLTAGDMYLDDLGRVCISIDYDLVDMNARDKFRNSKFFMNEFTQQEIQDNQYLFSRSLLLMIDNQMLFDFNVRMDNGTTTLILPFGFDYILTKDWKYLDHDVCVMVIPNTFFVRYVTNKGSLKNQSPDKSQISYVKGSLIPTTRPIGEGIYFAFVQREEDQFSSSFQEVELMSNGDFHFLFNGYANDIINNSSGNVIITMVFFKNLYRHIMYDNTSIQANPYNLNELKTNLLVIQREELVPYAMPIPIENMLLMKQIKGDTELVGEWVPASSLDINMHYPNIYQITDTKIKNGDQYRLYFFYQKNYVLEHSPLFDFYHRYLVRKFDMQLEKILNLIYFDEIEGIPTTDKSAFFGTFRKILGYDWYDHKYDLIDYINNHSELETPLEYKVNKLKEFIANDPECLHKYVLKQNLISDCYYLYVRDIDLSIRYRTDTTGETNQNIQFGDNPRYMFAFQNNDETNNFQCRIYIDGNLCMDYVHISYMLMEYFYIPTSLITEDSYIEVEVFHSCIHGEELYFPDKYTPAIISIGNNLEINPTLQDIYMYDEETGVEYDISKFKIYRVETIGNEELECPVFAGDGTLKVEYSNTSYIKIYGNDDSVLHRHISFNIWKSPFYIQTNVNHTSYPCLYLSGYQFRFNEEYIRVYQNGRLIPKSLYTIKTNFESIRIQILFEMKKGERISVDISPYRNKLIYFKDRIENYKENAFIIDLTDHINKPFDARYYDVFSNGRKLSVVNIHLISPTKIALTNLTSSHRLEIYEKDRDWEYFGLDYKTHKFYFTPDELIDETFVSTDEKQGIIDDIINVTKDPSSVVEKNTDNEESVEVPLEPERLISIKIFYYEELLPKRLANPDSVQFNKEYLQTEYKEIFDTYVVPSNNTISVNDKNSVMRAYDVLLLRPDITMRGDSREELMVLLTGDYDSVMDEQNQKGDLT